MRPFPNECPECESTNLRWNLYKTGPSDVQDGRLRMSEIGIGAYLSCEECGETLGFLHEHEVENLMNLGASIAAFSGK